LDEGLVLTGRKFGISSANRPQAAVKALEANFDCEADHWNKSCLNDDE